MWLKRMLWLSLGFLVSGLAFASSFPGDQPSPVKKWSQVCDCNWARQPLVHYYSKVLERYQIQTVLYPKAMRIVIPDYVFFIPMSSVVSYHAQDPFYVLAALLQQFPGAKITIKGYTDNIADSAFNQKDSLQKAQKLSAYLWMNHIPNETQELDYNGLGEKDPIANNLGVNGMASNRRVEVFVAVCRARSSIY